MVTKVVKLAHICGRDYWVPDYMCGYVRWIDSQSVFHVRQRLKLGRLVIQHLSIEKSATWFPNNQGAIDRDNGCKIMYGIHRDGAKLQEVGIAISMFLMWCVRTWCWEGDVAQKCLYGVIVGCTSSDHDHGGLRQSAETHNPVGELER